jgi:hypothetical protein
MIHKINVNTMQVGAFVSFKVIWEDTNILEYYAASIFTLKTMTSWLKD